MYLHNILIKPKNELIRKVYEVQKLLPTKGDWYQQVVDDKSKLGIDLSDIKISKMSKDQFKKKVSESVKKICRSLSKPNCNKK